MQLLFGTHNPAKLLFMRQSLSVLSIELLGLSDISASIPLVDETGENPLQNARLKAIAYRDAAGMDTLAADSGLYIEGIDDAVQPAEHVRRVSGQELNDEEMIAYYASFVAARGGFVVARYRNALCIATADGQLYECFDDSIASAPFHLVDTPNARRTEGFPLDSLSIDIHTGQYFCDTTFNRTEHELLHNGYAQFIRKVYRDAV